MKHIKLSIFLPILMVATPLLTQPKKNQSWPNFDRVIIWGHSPHSHTHAYIHAAFYKAFQYLGYETHWVNDHTSIAGIELRNSLFITVGGHDRKIPIRADCLYMLHNCDDPKYRPLRAQHKCIIFQVYTHDALSRDVHQLHTCPYILYDLCDTTLYMPWATDLLPHEIDAIKTQLPALHKNNAACFIGTVWSGHQGNQDEIDAFKHACKDADIPFSAQGGFGHGLTDQSHQDAIMHAALAPAIQGAWQCQNGYIPCRIFKNISYGQMGITNNETVYKLFDKKIIYNADAYQLLFDSRDAQISQKEIFELMDFVRDNHTYLNRIDDMLRFLRMVQNS